MNIGLEHVFQSFDSLVASNGQDSESRDVLETYAQSAPGDHLSIFLAGVAQRLEISLDFDAPALHWILQQLANRARNPQLTPLEISNDLIASVKELDRLLNDDSPGRCYAMCVLCRSGDEESVEYVVDQLVERPLPKPEELGVVIGQLIQQDLPSDLIFPRLLDGLVVPSIAGFALDVANHFHRSQRIERHPAADRQQELETMLEAITSNLERLESNRVDNIEQLGQFRSMVEESISIAVSLCDALGLIGDTSSIPKLERALQLRHRRLRTEAAAALVRLGEEQAIPVLCDMAAEPVSRLRVIEFANELEVDHYVDDTYKTLTARAESEVALWLAQREQIGFPPHSLELYDEREQFWPGYDDPVECYLFQFTYNWSDGQFSNIAIAGPTLHAFSADLCDLPPDDIYAMFAGWYGEHEDIFELPIEADNPDHQVELTRFQRRLEDRGYYHIQPKYFTSFFGERSLVAEAQIDNSAGVVVVDSNDVTWLAKGHPQRPFEIENVLFLYRGRKLLRSFN